MTKRSINSHSSKHIPQRTCVACKKVKAKRELIRLVCTTDRGVEVDISGKKAGRGAYLCRIQECWEIGCKSGRLEHALRATITRDNQKQLLDWLTTFIKNSVEDQAQPLDNREQFGSLRKGLLEEQVSGRGK